MFPFIPPKVGFVFQKGARTGGRLSSVPAGLVKHLPGASILHDLKDSLLTAIVVMEIPFVMWNARRHFYMYVRTYGIVLHVLLVCTARAKGNGMN